MASGEGDSTSAPKNKNCKRCKSNLVGGLKCNNCQNHFHQSCARLCNSVKFTNNDTIICCERASGPACDIDAAFFDAMDNLCDTDKKVDISIFNYIIKQKDIIIEELRDKIKNLTKQLEIFEKLEVTKNNEPHKENKLDNAKTYADKTAENISKTILNSVVPNIPRVDFPKRKPTVSKEQVATAIIEEQTRAKCNDYINLTKNKNPVNEKNDQWEKVTYNKTRKRPVIVGNNSSIEVNGKTIKSVPKTTALHVYRVDPTMEVNDLLTILKSYFPEVTCEALTPKHPDLYSSFKVTIHEEDYNKAMNPSIWPSGAYVKPFLQLRRRGSAPDR